MKPETMVEFVYMPKNEWNKRVCHEFSAAHADSMFPAGCRCASMDSGGDCDWCHVYYEYLREAENG